MSQRLAGVFERTECLAVAWKNIQEINCLREGIEWLL